MFFALRAYIQIFYVPHKYIHNYVSPNIKNEKNINCMIIEV